MLYKLAYAKSVIMQQSKLADHRQLYTTVGGTTTVSQVFIPVVVVSQETSHYESS